MLSLRILMTVAVFFPLKLYSSSLEEGILAISKMAGCYEVKYQFQETKIIKPGYNLYPPYEASSVEYIALEKKNDKTIFLQHLLQMGERRHPQVGLRVCLRPRFRHDKHGRADAHLQEPQPELSLWDWGWRRVSAHATCHCLGIQDRAGSCPICGHSHGGDWYGVDRGRKPGQCLRHHRLQG